MVMTAKKTTHIADVQAALRKRYAPPEWLLFFEVRNQTGHGKGTVRYADAMAFNLFPSRGQEIHGFEFKNTRKDFLRELKDPEKSADLQKYCDRWWIVALNSDVVRSADELPPTWGLLVPDAASQLIVRVPAPKLAPVSVDLALLCSVLRGAHDLLTNPDKSAIEQAKRVGYRSGLEVGRQRALKEVQDNKSELDALHSVVSDFQAKTGVDVTAYDASEKFNQAVRRVRMLRDVSVVGSMRRLHSFVGTLKENLESEIELLLALGAQGRETVEGDPNDSERKTDYGAVAESGAEGSGRISDATITSNGH